MPGLFLGKINQPGKSLCVKGCFAAEVLTSVRKPVAWNLVKCSTPGLTSATLRNIIKALCSHTTNSGSCSMICCLSDSRRGLQVCVGLPQYFSAAHSSMYATPGQSDGHSPEEDAEEEAAILVKVYWNNTSPVGPKDTYLKEGKSRHTHQASKPRNKILQRSLWVLFKQWLDPKCGQSTNVR